MAQNSSKIQGKFYPLTPELAKKLRGAKLTAAEWRFWAYLVEMDPYGDSEALLQADRYHDLDPLTIQTECGISKPTYYRAIEKFQELGLLPEWFSLKKVKYADTERRIHDRLKAELGGEVEVITAVGRIDLLTPTEIIEIKSINDWKEALGKLLAYSAFFPKHQKRIHLFGNQDLAKLALAQATCSEFGITVTFEEVQ